MWMYGTLARVYSKSRTNGINIYVCAYVHIYTDVYVCVCIY